MTTTTRSTGSVAKLAGQVEDHICRALRSRQQGLLRCPIRQSLCPLPGDNVLSHGQELLRSQIGLYGAGPGDECRPAAPATARGEATDGWGTALRGGLIDPGSERDPIRHRRTNFTPALRRIRDTRVRPLHSAEMDSLRRAQLRRIRWRREPGSNFVRTAERLGRPLREMDCDELFFIW